MESAPLMPNLPPWLHKEPTYPFQSVCMDFCQAVGKRYGVLVDCVSNFPIIWKVEKENTAAVIHRVSSLFGIPEVLTTDGGKEFQSEKVQDML